MAYHDVSHFRSASPSRQQGAVLLVGLILLLVVTLVGVSTMQSTTMESKMVANMSDRQVCFEAAERALKTGEDWIGNASAAPSATASGSNPVYVNLNSGWWDTDSNWTSWSNAAMSSGAQESQAPVFVIEEIKNDALIKDDLGSLEGGKTVSNVSMYRVTSKGYGQRSGTKCILETTYARKF